MTKEKKRSIERRSVAFDKLRMIEPSGDRARTIEGYAVLFNQEVEHQGGYREVIHPGAFKKTLQEADIRALQNDDPNRVLGRLRSGSLTLVEDRRGLAFTIWPPPTEWAEDLLVSMARGDIDQMGFAFSVIRERWQKDSRGPVRHLYELRLYHISVATFPADPETNVTVRTPASGQERPALASARQELELARRRAQS